MSGAVPITRHPSPTTDKRPGRRPHSVRVLTEAVALRAFGHSVRAIAAMLKIGKTAVAEMLAGTHCMTHPSSSLLEPHEERVVGVSVHCPECGTPLAVVPCRVCRTRALQQLVGASDARTFGPGTPTPAEADAILAFDLDDEAKARFREVRRRRLAAGDPTAPVSFRAKG